MRYVLTGFLLLFSFFVSAQEEKGPFGNSPLKWYLNDEETHWIRFHTYAQLWGRYNDNNPGTIVFDEPESSSLDISVRRFRLALQAQLTDRLFVYTQLGINNLNYLTPRGTSVDLLDAYAEFELSPAFTIGGGKSAWNGLSRYSSPNTSKLLSYDLIFLALPTNDETDDLIRKLSLYAKGKVGRLDYRFTASKPFSVSNADDFNPEPIEGISRFTDRASSRIYSGYLKYEFQDQESNKVAFSDGSYHGSKSVLSVGAGFEFQNNALWNLESGDTIFNNMVLFAMDLFMDKPINKQKNTALTFYAAYFNYDFGPNYVRNIGANNIAVEVDPALASANGPGNAFPQVGTGKSFFTQAGFLLPKMGADGKHGQLQPYMSLQYSDFEALADPMVYYDLGVNWLIQSHFSKLSLNIQNRPVYIATAEGLEVDERKIMAVLQYIIRLE